MQFSALWMMSVDKNEPDRYLSGIKILVRNFIPSNKTACKNTILFILSFLPHQGTKK